MKRLPFAGRLASNFTQEFITKSYKGLGRVSEIDAILAE
jgi:hypothetical protein